MGIKVSETAEKPNQSGNKGKLPHIYVILFIMIALASLASYVVPSGQFERVEGPNGADILQPGTFSFIASEPVSFFDFMLAVPNGLMQSAEIIFGIIMIGGMFRVIERTGVIDIGVSKLAIAFSNKGLWIIPTLMIPFCLFTTFSGAVELSLVYLPVIMPLILKLGFDKVTATGIVLVSTIAGFAIALTAPANLGTAQTIAQLPLYSGIGYRTLILVTMLGVGMIYVWRYAKKVRANPELSIVKEEKQRYSADDPKEMVPVKATGRQIVASIALLLIFGYMFYGLLVLKWYFLELAGLYMILGIIVGLIAGLKPSDISESFNEGFKSILLGAMVVGIARGVAVVLYEGNILDTIVFGIGQVVSAMPGSVTAVMMMIVQGLFNFLVPSGSGQAMITMPIMTGLSDIAGVTRQTAVLAFQIGDGFSNIFYPTSGYFMATLAIAGLAWEKWLRFIFPLLIVWYVLGAVFLIIAQLMNWGPI